MITGAHFLFYSTAPDAGEGWLIFALPPAELAVHPASGDFAQRHADHNLIGAVLYLMCDDLKATPTALARE